MATVEIARTSHPSIMGGFCAGSIEWHFGEGDITKIEAKLSSGAATFNAKVGEKHSLANGWDESLVPVDVLEGLDDCYAHLRADDLEIENSDDDLIEWWYSYLASENIYRQTSSGDRPLLKTDLGPGTNNPTVLFDGTDDRVPIRDGTATIPDTSDFTIFVVTGPISTSDPAPLIAKFNTDDEDQGAFYGTNRRTMIQDDDGDNKQHSSDLTAANQIRCIQFDLSAEKAAEYLLGEETFGLSSGPKDNGFTFDSIGASGYDSEELYLDGGISELIIFKHYLTEDERQAVEGYLAHRWEIQANLLDTDGSSNHPYESDGPYIGDGPPSSDYINTLSHIELTSSYADCSTLTTSISNGDKVTWYMPTCQNPGTLTVKITYTVD